MILVTGGTGFLGSVLIKYLIDEGKDVIATKRTESVIPEDLKSSSLVQWVDVDMIDYFGLESLFSDIHQVYHCAAKISYQPADAKSMLHTNVEGTKHIVNLCLQHQVRLLHVSSIAALASNKNGKPVSETDKWEFNPSISAYSLAKYQSEMEVWRGIVEGLDAIIVNPSVIMGVGGGRRASGVIFDLVKKGMKIYPPGSVGVVDVEDVARIMILLMNSREITGERFILNSENITNKELLVRISQLMNKPAPSIEAGPFMLSIGWRLAKIQSFFLGKRPALTKESARAAAEKLSFDNSKIINTIGYQFRSVQETLNKMYETYYAGN